MYSVSDLKTHHKFRVRGRIFRKLNAVLMTFIVLCFVVWQGNTLLKWGAYKAFFILRHTLATWRASNFGNISEKCVYKLQCISHLPVSLFACIKFLKDFFQPPSYVLGSYFRFVVLSGVFLKTFYINNSVAVTFVAFNLNAAAVV